MEDLAGKSEVGLSIGTLALGPGGQWGVEKVSGHAGKRPRSSLNFQTNAIM